MLSSLQRQFGVLRSMAIYYGMPGRIRRLTSFYGELIGPGDLCFDIGAHVGNRVAAWQRLGARVVAVEPQAHLMTWLKRLYGNSPDVILVQAAVGAGGGTAVLHSSRANPTVSTLSDRWLAAVKQDESFSGVRWNETESVRLTTLDDLIAIYGRPKVVKIDVEGYEPEVLQGLSTPLPVISFEYIPAAIELAGQCLERLVALGPYEFNWFVGETHRWISAPWCQPVEMKAHLARLALESTSGDIFARLKPTS